MHIIYRIKINNNLSEENIIPEFDMVARADPFKILFFTIFLLDKNTEEPLGKVFSAV